MNCIIVKPYGIPTPYSPLHYKVRSLLKPIGTMNLICLRHHFYLARFHLEEDFKQTTTGGSWFVNGQYLTTRLWSSEFKLAKEKQSNTTAVWARLPSFSLIIMIRLS